MGPVNSQYDDPTSKTILFLARSPSVPCVRQAAKNKLDGSIRTSVLCPANGESVTARTNLAGGIAPPLSGRLSRRQRARHLRGRRRATGLLYQSLSLKGSFHCRSAQSLLRLFERTRSRNVERSNSHSAATAGALSRSHY